MGAQGQVPREEGAEQKAQDHFRTWVGRAQVEQGQIDATALERFLAVFEGMGVTDGDVAPLGLHWCVFPFNRGPISSLGPDGHPPRGPFLPPINLPRRMWAGGALEFVSDIKIGDTVERHSKIAGVTFKDGKSGPLAFVAVDHAVRTPRGVAIYERQNIVYRPAVTGPAPTPTESARKKNADIAPDETHKADASNTRLFWYSALTQNAHRIHYDLDYATKEEFYPGLVVHGPMQATFLMLYARQLRPLDKLTRFEYRGVAPLIAGPEFTLNCAAKTPVEDALWTASQAGVTSMRATAHWSLS